MIDVPLGVLQRVDLGNGAVYFTSPFDFEWKRFSASLDEAKATVALLKQSFPGFTFKEMYEDGEEMARFIFTNPNAPRIYVIEGQTILGNPFSEWVGEIATRAIKPNTFIDKNAPYMPGDKLKPGFFEYNGFAEFFWSK